MAKSGFPLLALLVVPGGTGILAVCAVPLIEILFPGDEGKPHVIEAAHEISPDSKGGVTQEHLDNGMGFGLGALYYEVHLHEAGARRFAHGDRDDAAVFYVEDTSGTVRSCLRIGQSDREREIRLAKAARQFRDVGIEYREIARTSIDRPARDRDGTGAVSNCVDST